MKLTTGAVDAGTISAIDHAEAMALAETEYGRLLDVVDQLDEADWARPTDCDGWDVRALLCHMLGELELNATKREFMRQFMLATRAAKKSGGLMIDEMTARQVHEHADLSTTELVQRLHEMVPKAVRGRRRTPRFILSRQFSPGPPVEGKRPFGFLIDILLNRDPWMHRIDLIRATGRELVLTAEHDGRIVADIVADWATTHGQPFTLVLDGPAGGTFVQGENGEEHRLDAIEFCRMLSGRAAGAGLLSQEVAF